MARHLPTLTFLSLLALLGGALMVIPLSDLLRLPVYFIVLALLARWLYKTGVQPIDPHFPAALFIMALLLNLISGLARYWIIAELYDFRADAPLYHYEGQYVAQFFQQFDFSVLDWYQARGLGTTNLVHVTGLFYTVLPPSLPGMFFWFAGLAFTGSVLFYRAFRLAFPHHPSTLYRLIIFFLPSILFWSASLGKESWLFFASGVAAYGLARYFHQSRLSGVIMAAVGLWLIFIIRPHIAGFMILALVTTVLFYFWSRETRRYPLVWILGGAIIIGLAIYFLPVAQNYIGIDELTIAEVEESYQLYQVNTSQGGSRFQAYSIFNPVGLAMGITTVLFRPFVWEARNPLVLVSALEATLWLFLFWSCRQTFWARIRAIKTDPWLAFLAFYVLLLTLAFTTMSNFGILTRQRVLLLPFLWMLVA